MNKPLTWVCSGIAATGMLMLGVSLYYALAYGHGDFEAGNFNQCRYWTERDATTGHRHRHWERNLAQLRSGIGSAIAKVDTWTLGGVLVAVSMGVWLAVSSSRHRHWVD